MKALPASVVERVRVSLRAEPGVARAWWTGTDLFLALDDGYDAEDVHELGARVVSAVGGYTNTIRSASPADGLAPKGGVLVYERRSA